jgi:tetratricopeptide (TPR) repeat protein
MKSVLGLIVLILAFFPVAGAQENSPDDQAHIEPRKPIKVKKDPAQPQGESSSRDSLIVRGGGRPPSGSGDGGDGVQEMMPYDPHRAAKDVEVGQYYLRHKNYRAALDRFNEALLYKPKDAEATYGVAQAQEKMGLAEQAYKNYLLYLEIFPGGPSAKDCQEALKRLAPRVSVANQGSDSEARQKIEEGEGLLAINNFQEAYSSFARAVEIAPRDPVANLRLAQSLVGLQRLDEARMYFQKCLELQPDERSASIAKSEIAKINAILGK